MTLPASAPTDVVAVCPLAALQQDGDSWAADGVVLVRHRGRVHGFEDTCPHAGASLAGAEVRRGAVTCPMHRARFRLSDGAPVAGPVRDRLHCFDVEQAGDALLVRRRRLDPEDRHPNGLRALLNLLAAVRRGQARSSGA